MSLRTAILALLHQHGAEDEQPDNGAATQPGAALPDSGAAAETTLQAQLAASRQREQEARRELAAERERHYQSTAEAFADQVRDRITPAQREPLVASLVQAARDDAASPLTTGSRVATIQSGYSAMPRHNLTQELVPAGSVILPNEAGGVKAEEDLAIDRVSAIAARNGRREAAASANGTHGRAR